MSNSATGRERREFGRRRTFLHGWIRLQGRPPITCIVHDMSEGGCLLEVPENAWLPYKFQITIESEGLTADCEIRHQRNNKVGVYFVKTEEKPTTGKRASLDDIGTWNGKQAARTVRRIG